MESGELRIDVHQLRATASQWRELDADLGVLAPPLRGQPWQPITAAVSGVHTAMGLAAAALAVRTQATAGAVEAAVAGYVTNEAVAGAEMAVVPQCRAV
ncbi:hypothetical protein [Mycobacterium riyadhense]|uniref:Uncharacterized protein n=1 Tax=Mycobacterium riyadhense TaxID=486698 RepID=A0A653EEV5_9MYCO|nr:hypothetical protein [Mycobacterium riyadhense]VTO96044.1 hypothetical protein BIN_B_01327 [Mycobacterium riyadhense]